MEAHRLLVVLDELFIGLNHEEDVFRRQNVKRMVINVRDALTLRQWIVFAKIYNQSEHTSVFYHHFANSDIAYVGRTAVGSQNIRENHVVNDVHYAHINEAQTIILFKPSRVAQRTVRRVCAPLFALNNCGRNVCGSAQFYSVNLRVGLAIRSNRVMRAQRIAARSTLSSFISIFTERRRCSILSITIKHSSSSHVLQ